MTTTASVCVVVPVYRAALTADEELSLRHLEHYLPALDRCFLMPDTLALTRRGFGQVRFPARAFRDFDAYNHLMLDRELYARFTAYEYVLIYQPDALVLDSGIERFLALGIDYLGAPWIEYDEVGRPRFAGVGNGGLSLRRVDAFRRLLSSRVRTMTPAEYYRFRAYADRPFHRRLIGACRSATRLFRHHNSLRHELSEPLNNEDWFIAYRAPRYSPGFAVGSLDQALAFAFEQEPRYCLEHTGGRMPFGAHAWSRYDRAFWEPHLLA